MLLIVSAGLTLLAALVVLRRATPPVRPPANGVHVPGRVVRLRGAGIGGWVVEYPLPDGSRAELVVPYTRPSPLREGMVVPVLVDPHDPRRARLDYAPQQRVNRVLKTSFAVVGALATVITVVGLALLVLLRR